jgi:hypothetical protein
MIYLKLLIVFLVPINAFSQDLELDRLASKIRSMEKAQEEKLKSLNTEKSYRDSLLTDKEELFRSKEKAKSNFLNIDLTQRKHMDLLLKILDEELAKTAIPITEQIRLSFYKSQKKYRRYLKCLRRGMRLKPNQFRAKIKLCKPSRAMNYAGSKFFLQKLSEVDPILSLKKPDLQERYLSLTSRFRRIERDLILLNTSIAESEKELNLINNSIKHKKYDYDNKKYIFSNKAFFNCNTSTPTIDLEGEAIHSKTSAKGPFYGVPRDH